MSLPDNVTVHKGAFYRREGMSKPFYVHQWPTALYLQKGITGVEKVKHLPTDSPLQILLPRLSAIRHTGY